MQAPGSGMAYWLRLSLSGNQIVMEELYLDNTVDTKTLTKE